MPLPRNMATSRGTALLSRAPGTLGFRVISGMANSVRAMPAY